MSRRKNKNRNQNVMTATTPAERVPVRPGAPSIGELVKDRMQKLNLSGDDKMKIPLMPPPSPVPTLPGRTWPIHWPKCPESYNVNEWVRALQNKEYYEERQRKDGERRAWFQYPRHPYQYSELVYCTPHMMEELLKHMPTNRKQKLQWIDTIARDLEDENWMQTHESIAVNTEGNMHDGQHRAEGVIKSGKAWPMYITWNVPPEAIFVSDSGERRKVNDKIQFLFPDAKITNKTAALCRSLMWGLDNRSMKYSETEIAEFAVKHQDAILWVSEKLKGYRADIQAVIVKALLWYGETEITPFVERLRQVQFLGTGDPVKTFYLWLQQSKKEGARHKSYTGPLLFYKKTLAAVQAYALNKPCHRIHVREEDLFQWLPGWEVPPEAPCGGKPFNKAI